MATKTSMYAGFDELLHRGGDAKPSNEASGPQQSDMQYNESNESNPREDDTICLLGWPLVPSLKVASSLSFHIALSLPAIVSTYIVFRSSFESGLTSRYPAVSVGMWLGWTVGGFIGIASSFSTKASFRRGHLVRPTDVLSVELICIAVVLLGLPYVSSVVGVAFASGILATSSTIITLMHAGIIIPSLNHSSSIDSNSTHYSTFASVCSLTRHRFTPLDYNTVGIIAAILFAGLVTQREVTTNTGASQVRQTGSVFPIVAGISVVLALFFAVNSTVIKSPPNDYSHAPTGAESSYLGASGVVHDYEVIPQADDDEDDSIDFFSHTSTHAPEKTDPVKAISSAGSSRVWDTRVILLCVCVVDGLRYCSTSLFLPSVIAHNSNESEKLLARYTVVAVWAAALCGSALGATAIVYNQLLRLSPLRIRRLVTSSFVITAASCISLKFFTFSALQGSFSWCVISFTLSFVETFLFDIYAHISHTQALPVNRYSLQTLVHGAAGFIALIVTLLSLFLGVGASIDMILILSILMGVLFVLK